jgi:metal-sulfur cluster biosynthetic enzyme
MDETDTRLRALWNVLATVIDPEIGLDIVTLGMVYEVEIDGVIARVTHTLTTPGCPMERSITEGIREAALLVDGIQSVETRLVCDPAWHAGMIASTAWQQ